MNMAAVARVILFFTAQERPLAIIWGVISDWPTVVMPSMAFIRRQTVFMLYLYRWPAV